MKTTTSTPRRRPAGKRAPHRPDTASAYAIRADQSYCVTLSERPTYALPGWALMLVPAHLTGDAHSLHDQITQRATFSIADALHYTQGGTEPLVRHWLQQLINARLVELNADRVIGPRLLVHTQPDMSITAHKQATLTAEKAWRT